MKTLNSLFVNFLEIEFSLDNTLDLFNKLVGFLTFLGFIFLIIIFVGILYYSYIFITTRKFLAATKRSDYDKIILLGRNLSNSIKKQELKETYTLCVASAYFEKRLDQEFLSYINSRDFLYHPNTKFYFLSMYALINNKINEFDYWYNKIKYSNIITNQKNYLDICGSIRKHIENPNSLSEEEKNILESIKSKRIILFLKNNY